MTRCNRIAVAHSSPSLASQLLQGIASGRSATASVKAETTGVICNARGYAKNSINENPQFNDSCVIDLDI
jgi:hypothetical protein